MQKTHRFRREKVHGKGQVLSKTKAENGQAQKNGKRTTRLEAVTGQGSNKKKDGRMEKGESKAAGREEKRKKGGEREKSRKKTSSVTAPKAAPSTGQAASSPTACKAQTRLNKAARWVQGVIRIVVLDTLAGSGSRIRRR